MGRVELEAKFVTLGWRNINKWNLDLRGWPNLGTARLINGDSRRLRAVIEGADLVVSSPPFPTDQPCSSQTRAKKDYFAFTRGDGTKFDHEMRSPGNLANLPEGKFEMVVGSPPYNEARIGGIETMRRSNDIEGDYGQSPGQLGAMKEGSFSCVVSSPPYSDIRQDHRDGYKGLTNYSGEPRNYWPTQRNQENLGNVPPDTFWAASKEIVQQCHDLLGSNGHAIWVCKDYVKAKKRVPFSDNWLALCESVGFKLVCRHKAMLVKSHGKQTTITGECEEIQTERKSFFRRLAESKGSPRIDWEDVICLMKCNL